MSGFFNDGIFISEGHYIENNINSSCNNCGPWLKRGYSINHSEIKDYNDTTEVIAKLKATY
jgi:hypothetical protein